MDGSPSLGTKGALPDGGLYHLGYLAAYMVSNDLALRHWGPGEPWFRKDQMAPNVRRSTLFGLLPTTEIGRPRGRRMRLTSVAACVGWGSTLCDMPDKPIAPKLRE
jgi:hypothetical protein